jgi:hypothetical protein
MIPYANNDVTQQLEYLLDVELNMERFRLLDLTTNTNNYSTDCYDMCNYSTMLLGHQLLPFCEDDSLIVHEGVFDMLSNHVWLEIEGAIVDATLAQFISTAKPLSLIDSTWGAYQSVRRIPFKIWEEKHLNSR